MREAVLILWGQKFTEFYLPLTRAPTEIHITCTTLRTIVSINKWKETWKKKQIWFHMLIALIRQNQKKAETSKFFGRNWIWLNSHASIKQQKQPHTHTLTGLFNRKTTSARICKDQSRTKSESMKWWWISSLFINRFYPLKQANNDVKRRRNRRAINSAELLISCSYHE